MTTRKDIFYWELATRRAQELGFKIVTDTSDDRFHLRRTYPAYAEDNVLARLSTVAEVLAYLEGWGDRYGGQPGRVTKKNTHRAERRLGKHAVREERAEQ